MSDKRDVVAPRCRRHFAVFPSMQTIMNWLFVLHGADFPGEVHFEALAARRSSRSRSGGQRYYGAHMQNSKSRAGVHAGSWMDLLVSVPMLSRRECA